MGRVAAAAAGEQPVDPDGRTVSRQGPPSTTFHHNPVRVPSTRLLSTRSSSEGSSSVSESPGRDGALSMSSSSSAACRSHIARYMERGSASISTACEPVSTTRPSFSTTIRSQPLIVDRRCATKIDVRPSASSSRLAMICASVCVQCGRSGGVNVASVIKVEHSKEDNRTKHRAPEPDAEHSTQHTHLGVERGRRLVADEQPRRTQERARDRDALLLPAGELEAALAHVARLRVCGTGAWGVWACARKLWLCYMHRPRAGAQNS
jgi:hypothetical protein